MKRWMHIACRSLLLVLFISYYANITFFSHAHIVNGVTIAHSHFYSDFDHAQPPLHEHNLADIQLIAAISQFTVTDPPLQVSVQELFPQYIDSVSPSYFVHSYLTEYEGDSRLRAPPCC